jgi:hypothetical protein
MRIAIAKTLACVGRGRIVSASRPVTSSKSLRYARMLCLMLAAGSVSACWGPAALNEPDRLTPIADELAPIRAAFDDVDLWQRYSSYAYNPRMQMAYRNDIITARMYAIDINYTNYEGRLGADAHGVDFTTAVLSHAASLAVPLISVDETKNIVSAAGGLVGFYGTAYNEKLLLQQTIQHVQAGMRQARYRQAGHILANMRCNVADYPLGLALSDLEIYYRAGTFSTGLIKVTENVAKATTDAQAEKNKQNPNPPADADATLAANRTDAITKDSAKRGRCASVIAANNQGGNGANNQGGNTGPGGTVVRSHFVADNPGDILMKFVFPNGIAAGANAAHQKEVTDFMDEKNITDSLALFLRSAQYTAQRAEIVRRLHARGLI